MSDLIHQSMKRWQEAFFRRMGVGRCPKCEEDTLAHRSGGFGISGALTKSFLDGVLRASFRSHRRRASCSRFHSSGTGQRCLIGGFRSILRIGSAFVTL
jgi:hypothetical protein